MCEPGAKESAEWEGLCCDLSDVCNHPHESQTTCFHPAVAQCYLQVNASIHYHRPQPTAVSPTRQPHNM
jgi:hypothetical protein